MAREALGPRDPAHALRRIAEVVDRAQKGAALAVNSGLSNTDHACNFVACASGEVYRAHDTKLNRDVALTGRHRRRPASLVARGVHDRATRFVLVGLDVICVTPPQDP